MGELGQTVKTILNLILATALLAADAPAEFDPQLIKLSAAGQSLLVQKETTLRWRDGRPHNLSFVVKNFGADAGAGHGGFLIACSTAGKTAQGLEIEIVRSSGDLEFEPGRGDEGGRSNDSAQDRNSVFLRVTDRNGWDGRDGWFAERNRVKLQITPETDDAIEIHFRSWSYDLGASDEEETFRIVWEYAPAPDLVVEEIWSERLGPGVLNSVRVRARLRNRGNRHAKAGLFSSQEARISIGGTVHGVEQYDDLSPGETMTVEFAPIFFDQVAEGHAVSVEVFADSRDSVREIFEDNNHLIGWLSRQSGEVAQDSPDRRSPTSSSIQDFGNAWRGYWFRERATLSRSIPYVSMEVADTPLDESWSLAEVALSWNAADAVGFGNDTDWVVTGPGVQGRPTRIMGEDGVRWVVTFSAAEFAHARGIPVGRWEVRRKEWNPVPEAEEFEIDGLVLEVLGFRNLKEGMLSEAAPAARKAVVLIHGELTERADAPEDPYAFWTPIRSAFALLMEGQEDWDLLVYDWKADSSISVPAGGSDQDTSLLATTILARAHGGELGETLAHATEPWRKVHLVAHGAGFWVARAAAERMRRLSPQTIIEVTALDPLIVESPVGVSARAVAEATGNVWWRPHVLESYFVMDLASDYDFLEEDSTNSLRLSVPLRTATPYFAKGRWDRNVFLNQGSYARNPWVRTPHKDSLMDARAYDPNRMNGHSGPLLWYSERQVIEDDEPPMGIANSLAAGEPRFLPLGSFSELLVGERYRLPLLDDENSSHFLLAIGDGEVPQGMAMSTESQSIEGIPKVAGEFSFRIRAISRWNPIHDGEKDYSIRVVEKRQGRLLVFGNGREITDGQDTASLQNHTHFGAIDVGVSPIQPEWIERRFSIENVGSASVDDLVVALHEGKWFQVVRKPKRVVEPGEIRDFTVRFSTAVRGDVFDEVIVAHTGGSRPSFRFSIAGLGIGSALRIEGKGEVIEQLAAPRLSNGTDFGEVCLGGAGVVQIFSILNVGRGLLQLSGEPVVSVKGSDTFTVVQQPQRELAAASRTEFALRHSPSGRDPEEVEILLLNNGTASGLFSFLVSGRGVNCAESWRKFRPLRDQIVMEIRRKPEFEVAVRLEFPTTGYRVLQWGEMQSEDSGNYTIEAVVERYSGKAQQRVQVFEKIYAIPDSGKVPFRVSFKAADEAVAESFYHPEAMDTLVIRRGNRFLQDLAFNGEYAENSFTFGSSDDVILIADLGGDFNEDVILVTEHAFLIDTNRDGGDAELVLTFGRADDVIMVGDMNGDGRDELVLRRGDTYLIDSARDGGDPERIIRFGEIDDEVMIADTDGNGSDELVVRKGATYWLDRLGDGGGAEAVHNFGRPEDWSFYADFDGDGREELVAVRGNEFLIDLAADGGEAEKIVIYGVEDDAVFVADMNGDGVDDLVIRRGNQFLVDLDQQGGRPEAVFFFGEPDDEILLLRRSPQ